MRNRLLTILILEQIPKESTMEDVENELLQLAIEFDLKGLKILCERSIETHCGLI